ncbi:MAG: CBS domain-containing protein [Candidatus Magasanikbacteria bacterium]|nr:CBS domain-containing protein [Candidatus Magasanikbacteria bacterium]
MLVKEIMKTSIVSISKGTPFFEVAKTLLEKRVSGAPVVDEHNKLIGVVSEKDLFKAIYPTYNDFYTSPELYTDFTRMEQGAIEVKNKKVEECMSARLITATPETPVLKVGALMVATGIHRVPVVDGEKLVGMISRGDVYRSILREHFDLWEV